MPHTTRNSYKDKMSKHIQALVEARNVIDGLRQELHARMEHETELHWCVMGLIGCTQQLSHKLNTTACMFDTDFIGPDENIDARMDKFKPAQIAERTRFVINVTIDRLEDLDAHSKAIDTEMDSLASSIKLLHPVAEASIRKRRELLITGIPPTTDEEKQLSTLKDEYTFKRHEYTSDDINEVANISDDDEIRKTVGAATGRRARELRRRQKLVKAKRVRKMY